MSSSKGGDHPFTHSLSLWELQGKARRGALPPLPPQQPHHLSGRQHLHLP